MHDYILDGTNIVKEIVTDTANCPKYVNEYLYDLDGTVCGLKHNGTAYYFYKNLQGDVIAITDDRGATVARYTYDAWGKVLTVKDASGNNITSTAHIANINPFRYRSYYYDTETKLYYLQSRYYNSEVGRCLNADEPLILVVSSMENIKNLYCYCDNYPISKVDLMGYWIISLEVKTVAVVLDVILLLLALSVTFFAPAKTLSWSRKIFSWARKKFDSLINKIASVLAGSLDTILYELVKKYNSVGRIRIKIAASAIAWFIMTLIDLTPGNIVANLIDHFDKDGKSGYIRF